MTDAAAVPTAGKASATRRTAATRRRDQLLLGYRTAGLVGALGVLLYMMWPDFSSDFGVIDDHTVIDMMGRRSRLPVSQIPHWVSSKTAEPIGRFRPVYWLGQVLESATAGHHPTWWYFDRWVLAAITLTAVYLTALRFTGAAGAAVLSLTPFSGFQFETWTRLGPNEAYAVPLAVVGIAVLVHQMAAGRSPARLWPGYALLLASAFAKENFLLVALVAVPATILVYGVRRMRKPDWTVLGIAAGLAVVDAIGILVKTQHHGPVYPQSHTWATFKQWVTYFQSSANPYQAFGTGCVVAAVLLTLYATTRQRAVTAVWLAASVVLLVVPQLAFYAGNAATGRYLYPMALGPTIVWGICLWRARELAWPARPVISVILLFAVAWPLHLVVPQGRAAAVLAATGNNAFQKSLATLEATIAKDRPSVVVLQPFDAGTDIERVESLARYLANTGGLSVMIAPPIERNPGFDTELAQQIDQWSLHGEHNILPYHPVGKCFSVLYGPMPAVCGASAPAI